MHKSEVLYLLLYSPLFIPGLPPPSKRRCSALGLGVWCTIDLLREGGYLIGLGLGRVQFCAINLGNFTY